MRKMAVISLVLLLFLVGCGKEEAAQKPEQKTEKEPKNCGNDGCDYGNYG